MNIIIQFRVAAHLTQEHSHCREAHERYGAQRISDFSIHLILQHKCQFVALAYSWRLITKLRIYFIAEHELYIFEHKYMYIIDQLILFM